MREDVPFLHLGLCFSLNGNIWNTYNYDLSLLSTNFTRFYIQLNSFECKFVSFCDRGFGRVWFYIIQHRYICVYKNFCFTFSVKFLPLRFFLGTLFSCLIFSHCSSMFVFSFFCFSIFFVFELVLGFYINFLLCGFMRTTII